MDVAGKVIVVTGGANGIGRALCERFHAEGARKVVVADLEESNAQSVALTLGGDAFGVDVRDESALAAMVAKVEADHGGIDLFCSNAGIMALDGEPWWATSAANETWQAMWEHVFPVCWRVAKGISLIPFQLPVFSIKSAMRLTQRPNTLQSALLNRWQSPTLTMVLAYLRYARRQ